MNEYGMYQMCEIGKETKKYILRFSHRIKKDEMR
jgi:hypothetical protein